MFRGNQGLSPLPALNLHSFRILYGRSISSAIIVLNYVPDRLPIRHRIIKIVTGPFDNSFYDNSVFLFKFCHSKILPDKFFRKLSVQLDNCGIQKRGCQVGYVKKREFHFFICVKSLRDLFEYPLSVPGCHSKTASNDLDYTYFYGITHLPSNPVHNCFCKHISH